jgi:hypothetical protein
LCLGLKTDDRSLPASGDSPMILAGCHEILGSVLELVNCLNGRLFVDSPRKLMRDG